MTSNKFTPRRGSARTPPICIPPPPPIIPPPPPGYPWPPIYCVVYAKYQPPWGPSQDHSHWINAEEEVPYHYAGWCEASPPRIHVDLAFQSVSQTLNIEMRFVTTVGPTGTAYKYNVPLTWGFPEVLNITTWDSIPTFFTMTCEIHI